MRKLTMIVLISFCICACACESINKEKSTESGVDLSKIEESENQLFSKLKEGKIKEAFAMHSNNSNYRNIVDGSPRTFEQMDAYLRENEAKGIKTIILWSSNRFNFKERFFV